MTAGILGVGVAGYFIIARQPSKIDLNKLTVPVQAQNLTVRITANGTVVPIQSVNLSPKTSGRLAQLLVEQGDTVQEGQKIAVMENAELQAQYLKTQADLNQAQARLAEAKAGSRPEEIAQAEARLAQAQARLNESLVGNPAETDQAKAQVSTARSRLALAQTRFQRYRDLAAQGAITQDKLDEVLTEARTANAALFEAEQRLQQSQNTNDPQINQLKASVEEAKIALEQLRNGTRSEEIAQLQAAVNAAKAQVLAVQVQLQDTIIRAPFSGTVTQKYATEGAFVTPTTSASSTASATSTSIVALARGIEVLAKVPEVDVGQLKLGQPVEIVADAYPDQVFQGRVQRVAPEAVVEQNVTSFEVRVAILTGQKELRSGMNVDLTFLGKQLNNALAVPTVAIVTQDGKTGVMVPDEEKKPTFKPVVIGPSIEDQTQILEGVNSGDRVFIDLPKDFKKKGDQSEN
ncbi:MAG TPA: efflux RND transporter periplasmic adaptor subunit, partial [Coleofasciculaceae cyanobacterium]